MIIESQQAIERIKSARSELALKKLQVEFESKIARVCTGRRNKETLFDFDLLFERMAKPWGEWSYPVKTELGRAWVNEITILQTLKELVEKHRDSSKSVYAECEEKMMEGDIDISLGRGFSSPVTWEITNYPIKGQGGAKGDEIVVRKIREHLDSGQCCHEAWEVVNMSRQGIAGFLQQRP